jgi:hypothetical protein
MVGALAVVAATVNAATITVQPQDRAAFAGQGVQLGIVAIGSSPVFQWHSTNGPIAAATGSVLSLSNLSIADAGRYWAVVSDADGAVTSRVARLTVLDFSQEPGLYVAVTGFVGVTEAPVLELFTLGVGPLNNTLPAVAGTNADFYFLLERTMNFTAWTPIQANLHYVPLAWRILPLPDAPTHAFHRVAAISAFAPRDSDGDRIDDIYELEHPEILNPLDPTDAARDPDMNGFTHQQEYRILRGLNLSPDHYISREVTSFNFGLPTARVEAMSREVSAFNGERPPPTSLSQMLSREVTAFNFGLPSSPTEAISREVSSFNFGVPVHPVEALSREVSVFNGEQPPPTSIAVAISREVTVFNFGLPIATVEAISREVSVFNDLQ